MKTPFLMYYIVFLILGVFLGFNIHFLGNNPINTILSKSDNGSIDIFSSKKIQEVENIIKDNYYKFSEKPKIDIENAMITSIVESLGDKHSSYFPPKEAKEFSEVLSGDFEGIGAVIDEHIRGIIIRKIFQNSPAQKSGLQDGDVIIKVGEESMLGQKTEEAVKKIRGPKGSKIIITYTRGDNSHLKTTEVTRDTIIIPSTTEKVFTGALSDIGYIEVAFFGEHTPEEFQKSFDTLIQSSVKGIILDFRNNGGGYLNTAVDILSFLLPDNSLAVTTKENDPTKNLPLYTYKNPSTNTEIPVVMLVNNLSASATEIVAGALKDYKRALIIGEQTYGKGSVQDPIILSDGSMLKITIAKWYTPKDKNIDHDGIAPDIRIPLFDKDFIDRYDRQLENAKKILDTILSTNKSYDDILTELQQKDFTQ